jgi:hypothetical protein
VKRAIHPQSVGGSPHSGRTTPPSQTITKGILREPESFSHWVGRSLERPQVIYRTALLSTYPVRPMRRRRLTLRCGRRGLQGLPTVRCAHCRHPIERPRYRTRSLYSSTLIGGPPHLSQRFQLVHTDGAAFVCARCRCCDELLEIVTLGFIDRGRFIVRVEQNQ